MTIGNWLLSLALLASTAALAVRPDSKTLPIGLAPWEVGLRSDPAPEPSAPPEGHVRSLGEWEEAEAAMTLWTNPSLVKALVDHGPVKLFADTRKDLGWWDQWLDAHEIAKTAVSYFVVHTDSIWIRDYGPWFILDGRGVFGIVHNQYNRPRPNDNKVAAFMARELNLPFYETGLTHTGGNYYNDGMDDGFSSTLVYSENSELSKDTIDGRMRSFLGIDRYATSPLAPGITIQHLDTFGKLVSPDTWVFSDFPEGSPYREDSENYLAMLRGLKSPYGTPYRILRLKMRPISGSGGDRYRAYLNSFISNRALYFPAYGDSIDDETKAVYQTALPGYEIIGVDAQETEWGDSVHCRNRNLLRKDTLFVFPTVKAGEITAEVYPTPGAELAGPPVAHVTVDGKTQVLPMAAAGDRLYKVAVPSGTAVRFYVEAKDTTGKTKSSPPAAPAMQIDLTPAVSDR